LKYTLDDESHGCSINVVVGVNGDDVNDTVHHVDTIFIVVSLLAYKITHDHDLLVHSVHQSIVITLLVSHKYILFQAYHPFLASIYKMFVSVNRYE
jgi:hypothetical protein